MNPEDYFDYRAMAAKGASPENIFLAAEKTLGGFAAIRVIRDVFGLSLEAAKEVMVRARGEAASLSGYQKQLLPSLKQALTDEVPGQTK